MITSVESYFLLNIENDPLPKSDHSDLSFPFDSALRELAESDPVVRRVCATRHLRRSVAGTPPGVDRVYGYIRFIRHGRRLRLAAIRKEEDGAGAVLCAHADADARLAAVGAHVLLRRVAHPDAPRNRGGRGAYRAVETLRSLLPSTEAGRSKRSRAGSW